MICDTPLRDGTFSYPAHAGNLGATSESFDYLFRVHGLEYRTLNLMQSSSLDYSESKILDMSTASERIEKMMRELGLDQPGFGKLAGASKSVVNQWLTGKIKTIAAEYAYNLQKRTGYSAEWIQLGAGPEKVSATNYDELFSGIVLETAKDLARLSKEKQLQVRAWAAVEAEIEKSQAELEETKHEKTRKSGQ